MKELAKMWYDTTTNAATGKYSQKRLMNWVAFNMALFLDLVSVIDLHTHPAFDLSLRVPSVELIGLNFAIALGASGLTLAGQYFNRKTHDDNGKPLEPIHCPPESEPINQPQNDIQNGL